MKQIHILITFCACHAEVVVCVVRAAKHRHRERDTPMTEMSQVICFGIPWFGLAWLYNRQTSTDFFARPEKINLQVYNPNV